MSSATLPVPSKTSTPVSANVHIGARSVPLAIQAVASTVLLVAICTCPNGCETEPKVKNWAYTVSAAVIAMVFSLVGLFLVSGQADTHDKVLAELPKGGPLTAGSLLALFLFVWWGVAVGICTFDSPFTLTGNGYFSLWAGFIASLVGLGASYTNQMVSAARGKHGSLLGLGAASIVMICALSIPDPAPFTSGAAFEGESLYGLVLACLTLPVCLFFALVSSAAVVEQVVLGLYAVAWCVMAGFVTFKGPFTVTSNGYFGAWAGAAISVRAAFLAFHGGSGVGSTTV